jgi:hypothetical protein
MSADLQLYRVTVTQEWSAEAEALVWAPDETTAKRLAQKRVEVDIEDAYSDSCWSVAKPEPLDDGVMDRMDDYDLWLILPDGEVCGNDRAGLAKFQAMLDPERLEALRLARIEAGNGQLALLEVARG